MAKAVELLAVVLNHPAREQNSLSRRESLKAEAKSLLSDIEAMLPAERFKGAWQRGKALELGNVVGGLLKENWDPATSELTLTIPIQ